MKKKILYKLIYLISPFLFTSTIISCTNSEEKLQHDLMSIYELNSNIMSYDSASQILEVTAQLDYVDLGYLKVDIHPLDVTSESAWRSSYIYDDFEGDFFHGQFSIPETAKGEYEVVFYIVDHNNIQTKLSTEIYIDQCNQLKIK